MFNLKKQSGRIDDATLLLCELRKHQIVPSDHHYVLTLGDEDVVASSLQECCELISQGIQEIKKHLWECWQDISNLCDVISHNDAGNTSSIDNLLFLSNVKKAYLFSLHFPNLKDISKQIKAIHFIDAADVHENVLSKFNYVFLQIKLLHYLVMREIYRTKLIKRYSRMTKIAQISGPWANADLPMKERVWEYDSGEEEDMGNRTRARKEQSRYNPEYNSFGFYFVWQDLSTFPYDFNETETDSPYKSRKYLTLH